MSTAEISSANWLLNKWFINQQLLLKSISGSKLWEKGDRPAVYGALAASHDCWHLCCRGVHQLSGSRCSQFRKQIEEKAIATPGDLLDLSRLGSGPLRSLPLDSLATFTDFIPAPVSSPQSYCLSASRSLDDGQFLVHALPFHLEPSSITLSHTCLSLCLEAESLALQIRSNGASQNWQCVHPPCVPGSNI